MNFKKMTKRLCLSLVVILAVFALTACKKPGKDDEKKVYTYNTYTTLSPSNWNELTYQDNNDTQVMSYIGSSFYTYDFKYDENGEIVPGEFEMEYAAATKLEDVTAKYAAEWNLPEDGKGYAYQITLRDDLKWENGDPIKAEDFVYTMQQQLDPLFQNYRADSFYVGATIIHNAENYVKQGSKGQVDNANSEFITSLDQLTKDADGVYTYNDEPVKIMVSVDSAWCGGNSFADYAGAGYISATHFEALAAFAGEDGYAPLTDESLKALQDCLDPANSPAWNEDASNWVSYIEYTQVYGAVDFSEVGIFVGDTEYDIVLVLDKSLPLLKDDGSLSYQAAYNMSSLPLVHKATFEANKVAPIEEGGLWTSTYNSSVETTMSWGPYKLESFQTGKEYVMVRNDNWYGYGVEANEGLYQTDRIVCETIAEWNTAWLKFQAGGIDGIGIDVTIADDYKGSDRAYYTPDDFVAALQLQSSYDGLKGRETEGVNKTLLTYTDFRKALSLAINRADFAAKTTTSSLAGFGLFNSMHYYDVENGGVFRNTDEAKQVLCEIYNIDPANYGGDLDKAVAAITGYDLAEAKKLVDQAYDAAIAAGDLKETDTVVLTMGTGAINETVTRRFNFIDNAWQELVKGTKLEGKFKTEVKDFATAWSNDFRAGAYDVCMGGWSGAAWDPGYFLLAYLSPDYMYSAAWDTSSVMLEFTMKGVAEDGGDITDTMSLIDWYNCLNGASGAKYDFSATALEQSQRLQLIAALEKEVLKVYYTVPLYNSYSASLISFKVDYTTYEYNTFMGYGGIKYMTYNYTDAEWAKVVAEANGQLNYK